MHTEQQILDILAASRKGRSLPGGLPILTQRQHLMIRYIDQVAALPGDVIELGVFDGLTLKTLALAAGPGKAVHGFDAFTGFTDEQVGPHDSQELKGQYTEPTKNIDNVRAFFADCPQVTLHVGLIEKTLPAFKPAALSLIHFDSDTYATHVLAFKQLWPLLQPGGIALFHDYHQARFCPGCRKAVDEFLGAKVKRGVSNECGLVVVK